MLGPLSPGEGGDIQKYHEKDSDRQNELLGETNREQLGEMNREQLGKMDREQLSEMNSEQLSEMSSEQIGEMSSEKPPDSPPPRPWADSDWVPPLLSSRSCSSLPTSVSWSPDGSLLAVTSEDARITVYSPGLEPTTAALDHGVVLRETEYIYSTAWCQATGRLAATGRYQPVHLWSLGEQPGIAATYKCINQLDELSHAYSVTLSEDGLELFCGLKGEVRRFDIQRPGRESDTHLLAAVGQGGIVSCLDLNPAVPVYAAGCYNRSTGLYSRDSGQLLCLLTGQRGGVTQVTFSRDGTRLYTGARRDGEIVCWDLREPGKVLFTLQREVSTNQRVQFSLSPCGGFLVSANTDGSGRLWDVEARPDPVSGVLPLATAWLLHGDAVTGAAWRPGGGRGVLATCSGQRHFPCREGGQSEDSEEERQQEEKSVRVWSLV